MEESIEKDSSIKSEDATRQNDKKSYSTLISISVLFVALLSLGILKLIGNGLFNRSPEAIYSDLKDYQGCKVVSNDISIKSLSGEIENALVCELSPIQQKTPESVQLAQKKVTELSEDIKEYSRKTIKELNILLEDDFVKKNPERAIDNILVEMKNFDLCLVVFSESKMAVDCSLKERDIASFNHRMTDVDKVNEYHQTQSKINHQLSLIDKKYFNYFHAQRNKETKQKNDSENQIYAEALNKKLKIMQEYEILQIEKRIKKEQAEIKKIK